MVWLNVWGKEWRETYERRKKGSGSSPMGFSSSPPLCQEGNQRSVCNSSGKNQSLRCSVFALPPFHVLPDKAPSWGWAARVADMPREPSPPNSGLPTPAVQRAPKAGWFTRGKALDNVEPMKGCSPAAPNRRPETNQPKVKAFKCGHNCVLYEELGLPNLLETFSHGYSTIIVRRYLMFYNCLVSVL